MTDVVIHRCRLRIVRRKGWSWGADANRLLRAAIAALPLLIARKLTQVLDAETADITETVSVQLRVTLKELFLLATVESGNVDSFIPDALFDQRLSYAVQQAIGPHVVEAVEAHDEKVISESLSEPVEESAAGLTDRHVLLRLLLSWQTVGELDHHLSALNETELELWLAALIESIVELTGITTTTTPERVLTLLRKQIPLLSAPGSDRRTELRYQLTTLIEIAERVQRALAQADHASFDFEQVLMEFGFSEIPESNITTRTDARVKEVNVGPDRPSPVAGVSSFVPTAPQARSISRATEFHIKSALPFLLLGPLSRISYFETLAAILEANRLTDQAHLFAAALAYKVLPAPARGWRRSDDDLRVAAVFAGLESPPTGAELAEFSRKVTGRLSALDSIVSYSLIKGHNPNTPVLLVGVTDDQQSGWLLLEMDGLFPLAYASDLADLSATLRFFSGNPVLVSRESVDQNVLKELDAGGSLFVTDALPIRGERWRQLRSRRNDRWYTNDLATKESTLIQIAVRLRDATSEAQLVWQELKTERVSIPTDKHSDFERSLTLAASLALGTISWNLWRHREMSTPLLALTRFGDLESRVKVTPTAVQIRLPRGARHRDLSEAGLLTDVSGVPWFENRKVEFLGG